MMLVMSIEKMIIETTGERLYPITELVRGAASPLVHSSSGILHLFCMHTSCSLVISESYDPTAKEDLEAFFKHLAPRNLPFIKHTLEGPDDSPSHMKSVLLQQNLALIVEEGELVLGTWQGIYLAEFRDRPHSRKILLKYQPDLG